MHPGGDVERPRSWEGAQCASAQPHQEEDPQGAQQKQGLKLGVHPSPVCSSPALCIPVTESELLKLFLTFLHAPLSTIKSRHNLVISILAMSQTHRLSPTLPP